MFATDYLQTLTSRNVEVVSSPARALRSRSLVTEDGTELDVDVVVCATGYAAADYLGQIDVIGEDGASLHDTWRDGAYAYLGMAVPGFPNFFMLYGPNTNVGSNSVIFVLEAQARYIVRALKHMRRKRKSYIAVRQEATARLHRARSIAGWSGHRVDDAVQQLLSRGQRPGGHPVAAQCTGLLGDDAAIPGAGLPVRRRRSTGRSRSHPRRRPYAARADR